MLLPLHSLLPLTSSAASSLLSPRDKPAQELQEQGKRCLTDVGSRACSSPSLAPGLTLCHGGVKNLHLHHLSASPTCVRIVPAMWQQPSNCSGFTRGGTQQPCLGEPGTCNALSGGRENGPASNDLLQTLLIATFFGLRRLTSHSRFAFPSNCFLCLKKLELVILVSYSHLALLFSGWPCLRYSSVTLPASRHILSEGSY